VKPSQLCQTTRPIVTVGSYVCQATNQLVVNCFLKSKSVDSVQLSASHISFINSVRKSFSPQMLQLAVKNKLIAACYKMSYRIRFELLPHLCPPRGGQWRRYTRSHQVK